MPADLGFLGVAVAAARQRLACVPGIGCGDRCGGEGGFSRLRCGGILLVKLIGAPLSATLESQDLFGQTLAGSAEGGQGLAELRSVPIDGDGFEHPLPGQKVSSFDILHGDGVGHVDGLGDRPGHEGLNRRHHLDMGPPGDEAGADAAHLARRIKHGIVLPLQMRGAFDGHGPAGEAVGLFDLLRSETKMPQQLEAPLPVGLAGDAELLFQQLLTQDRGRKGGMNGKGALQGLIDALEHGFAESLGLQFFPGYPRSGFQGSPSQAVGGDFLDLFLIVAQLFQGRRD